MRLIFAATLLAGIIGSDIAVAQTSKFAVIPAGKDDDLKLYRAGHDVMKGAEALGKMPGEAQLILWLAGNQFFAMDKVIGAFQKQNQA